MDFRILIARRYLVSRKQVTLISIITGISVAGVALGVAALIVVLSVMNGFYDVVRDLLVSLDPHVRITHTQERGLAGADSLMALALTLPHVVEGAPYVEGKALLVSSGKGAVNKVVIVRGVDPARVDSLGTFRASTRLGMFDVSRRGGVAGLVVGSSLGQRLALIPGAGSGTQVSLLSALGIERMLTQVLGIPQWSRFEVRGFFQLEEAYDESHVFVSLEEAQRLFRLEADRVSGIELQLDDLEQAGAVKAALMERLDAERYTVKTWYDLQKSLYDVMQLEKWGASAILMLICVVAAFNIVGSLTMVVIEKRRDVGVLQAMGVSRRDVRRIFLLEGVLIGALGTGIGFAVGLTLVGLQHYLALVPLLGAESFLIQAYPVSVRVLDLLLIGGVAFGLCVVAALYPAARASSIRPVQAIQMDR